MAMLVGSVGILAGAGAPDAASIETARELARVVRAAVAAASPSIVTIETIGGVQPDGTGRGAAATTRPARRRGGPGFRVAEGSTTGVVWSRDGLIVTSSFSFVRDPTLINVVLSDGTRHAARLLARDYIRRIALLKVEGASLVEARWVPVGEAAMGQYAIACGRGFGGATPSVSVGIISATGRRGGNALQTDAKLSPVNYGGPLIDLEGRIFGIIVPMAGAGSELAGVGWYDSGIGFAIPRERIAATIERMRRGEDIEAGKIGVVLVPSAPPEESDDAPPPRVVIAAVADPSPAQRAGIRPGDVIMKLNAEPVGGLDDLQRRLSDLEAGTTIDLTLERDTKPVTVRLLLARPSEIGPVQPPPPPAGDLPATTQPASRPSAS